MSQARILPSAITSDFISLPGARRTAIYGARVQTRARSFTAHKPAPRRFHFTSVQIVFPPIRDGVPLVWLREALNCAAFCAIRAARDDIGRNGPRARAVSRARVAGNLTLHRCKGGPSTCDTAAVLPAKPTELEASRAKRNLGE